MYMYISAVICNFGGQNDNHGWVYTQCSSYLNVCAIFPMLLVQNTYVK